MALLIHHWTQLSYAVQARARYNTYTVIKEKIIELSKQITTEGDASLNPNRIVATSLKDAIEAKYKGTKWFVALFESDEYYSHSAIDTNAFL